MCTNDDDDDDDDGDDDCFAVEAHTMRRSISHIAHIRTNPIHTYVYSMSIVFGAHTNSTHSVGLNSASAQCDESF